MVIDHLTIGEEAVERVSSIKFLGGDDLTWSTNTMAIMMKAEFQLRPLQRHWHVILIFSALNTLYKATNESILTYCIPVWFTLLWELQEQYERLLEPPSPPC